MYKKILFVVVILFQTISAYGQAKPYKVKANNLIMGAVNDNQTVGIVAGFSLMEQFIGSKLPDIAT